MTKEHNWDKNHKTHKVPGSFPFPLCILWFLSPSRLHSALASTSVPVSFLSHRGPSLSMPPLSGLHARVKLTFHHSAPLLGKPSVPSLSGKVLRTIHLCEPLLNPLGKTNGTFFYTLVCSICHSQTYVRFSCVLIHLLHWTVNSLRTGTVSYLSVPL